MRKLLVILFIGIFASIVLPSEIDSIPENNLRNFPPEIEEIEDQTVQEDQTFTYNVVVSDEDEEDTLEYFLNINGNASTSITPQGFVTINPDLNFNGTIEVEVTVSDGTDTDSENFNLEVTPINDDPVLDFINNFSYIEDESGLITVSAIDVDSPNLFYNCNPQGANINCSVNDNNITFTSPQNFNGSESVVISVNDGQGGQDNQTVQITVIPINDPPILDNIDNVTFIEDQSSLINVFANDIDGDNLNFGCNSSVNINCNTNGGQITLSATANYFGTESIEIFVQDGNGGSDTQNINVTVTPDNDAPILDFIPNLSYEEDQENIEAINLNATDVENDFLTYECNPQGNNIGCSINGNQLSISFPADYNGSENITITVSDASLSDSQDVTITVNSVNDPVLLIQSINDISENEDSDAIIINLSNHFDDVEDGSNLNYSLINLGELGTVISPIFNGTEMTINFNANKHGSGNPILRACDSSFDCLEEQFQITVISINDQPNLDNIPAPPSTIVINREYSFLVDPSNADVDDIQFDFSITSQPGGGNSTIEATENNQYANFLWYPNTLGNFSITIKLIDFNSEDGVNGTQEDSYTWNVEVVDASNNNPPEIENIEDQDVDEDGIFNFDLVITDLDDNIADLNVNVYDEYTQHISYGTSLETNFIDGIWVLTVTPESDWNGDINVIVSVSDGANSSNKEFLLTVNPVNDQPTFEFIDECEIEFDEDTSTTYDLYISDIDSHDYYNVSPQQTINYVLTAVGNEISGNLLTNQILFENETNFYDEANDLNQMTFISLEDFKGTQVFNLTLTDDSGEENDTYSQEFIVCVTNVNDPPLLDFIDDLSFDEDTDSNILVVNAVDDVVNPLYSDSDIASFSYQCNPYGDNVGCEVNGTDIIFYNIVEHFFGTQDFQIVVNDGDGGQDSQDITVTVNPINDEPVSNNISTVTNEDTPSTFSLSASDIENYDLTYSLIDNGFAPANGDIINNNDGTVTYTPNEDYNGLDSLFFKVEDNDTDTFNNLESNEARVLITINPINDPPVLSLENISIFSFDEDEVDENLRTFSFDVSDIDDEDVFSFTCNPLGPNLECDVEVVDSSPLDGGQANITITTPLNYNTLNGTESVEVTVFDGSGGQDSQNIEITVNPINDAPTVSDSAEFTNEDTEVIINFNGLDIDEDDLTYNIISFTTNGLIVNNNDGTATYTPNAEYNGEDSFTYIANDGFLDSEEPPAVVSITVQSINDPPILDDIGALSFDEDIPFVLSVNAVDVDQDDLTYLCNTITPNIICNVEGTEITFTAPEHYNGEESVEIIVSDGSGGQDSEIVNITINPINDAPTVSDSAESTNEDTEVIINFNGSDVDGDELLYTILEQTQNGLIVNNNDGTATYTPNAEYNGEDSFTYIANDGFLDSEEPPAVVSITVQSINDPPILDDIGALSFDEDIPFILSANAVDVDQDDLTYLCNTITPNIICNVEGTEITFTAPEHYNGEESVEIIVSDGSGGQDSEIVNITINPINDAPTVSDSAESTNEDTEVIINFNGSDVDGDELLYTILVQTQNGLIVNNNDGTATYTPNAEYNGEDSFTYIANDGFLDSEEPPAVVSITVIAQDDPPILADIDNNFFNEDENLVFSVSATDLEDEDESLTYSCLTGENLICDVNLNELTISALLNYNGIESLDVIVTDSSGNTDSKTIEITVIPVNDPPELTDMEEQTNEEVALNISLAGTDLDGDNPLYYSILNSADNGLILSGSDTLVVFPTELIEGGIITYRPNDDFSGIDDFTYIVNDGIIDSENSGTVTIEVISTNDAPVSDDVSVTVLEGQSITENYDIFDPDGDELTITIIDGPFEDGASVTDNGDGTFTYFAPGNDTGDPGDSFEYICTDTFGEESNVSTVFITILPSNDPPVLENIPTLIMDEDIPETITVSATDEEGHAVIFYCESGENILCEVDENDSSQITFSSAVEHWNGNETLIIYAIDENSAGGIDVDVSSQEFGVIINPINDTIETIEISQQVNEDEPLVINLFDYMINVDNLGDYLEPVDYEIISSGINGNCEVDATGIMTYIPNQDFPNSNDLNIPNDDTCSFKISDVLYESNESLINIEVIPINDNPILSDILPITFIEDQSFNYNLEAIDVDEGDILTYSCLSSENIFCEVKDNSLIITSSEDFFGTEIITVEVSDDYGENFNEHGTDFQEVSVTVLFKNDPPILSFIEDVIFNEDESIMIEIKASDPDPIVFHSFSCENSININCELSSYQEMEDSTYIAIFEFSASENYNGTEYVLISVEDDLGNYRLEDSQEVKVMVNAVNDVPLTSDINEIVTEDVTLTIDLSKHAVDVDEDILTYSIVEQAQNGVCQINENTGSLDYIPNENYPQTNSENGTDSCTFRVFDGSLKSNISTIDLEIQIVNDLPVSSIIYTETNEDTPFEIDLKQSVIDVENDELSYELILKGNNGVCSYLGDGLINYSPNPGYPTGQNDGKDICSFRANDGYGNSNESIINIIIRSENDFPVLSSINQPIQFKEDTISNPLFVQATDEDEDFLTFTCEQIIKQKNQVQNIFCDVDGSKVVFFATKHFNGTGFVRITVDDNYGGIDYQNVMVIVDQVYDPPQFRNLVSLEMNEENNSIFTINALDPDIEDSLSFSCLGLNKNIECKMNNNFVLKPDGSYDASFFLIPNTNFYGNAKIEVQVDDGYKDRYSIKDTILVEVLNVDDNPKIKPLVLNIDGNPLQIIDNQVSFNEVESDQEVKFVFEVSDPDSLGNPDELSVSSEPLGLYFSDGEFRQNLDIDLQSVCPIAECTSDFDDDSNVICTLECDNNFSGNFIQRFIVKDSDDLQDTVEVNINIKQVNDPPYSNIVLKDSLSTYSKNIDIKSLEGPIINEKIFFDQTKFYQDSVLTNPNPIPLNPDLDSLYYYYSYINESFPSYYFIWQREKDPSYFDPDTDPTLNQYPYDLYYRLELINGTDVFVIDDYIDDSIFNGIYAYSLAEIKSDSLYPIYNIDELYIPTRDSENTSFLKKYNNDTYRWRIVAQNYSMIINNKKESDCKNNNEIWDNKNGSCIEFEQLDVISYNTSEPFKLDIQYTKGDFNFILNPLDIYVDHYDMYFLPNDVVKEGIYEYQKYSYVDYGVNVYHESYDEYEVLNYFESNNIFQSIGTFDQFGFINIFVITIDENDNTFINIGSLNYQPILSNKEINRIESNSGDVFIEIPSESFDENSRILVYGSDVPNNSYRDDNIISSSLINITSNSIMNSSSYIHFDFTNLENIYNPDYLKINRISDNELIEYPTFIENNYILSEVNHFGKYILSFNENSLDNNIFPTEFKIKSCYPNPFNPFVSIDYITDIDSDIKLTIYNILGQKINEINYGYKLKGEYTAVWDGSNYNGFLMPSGTYFVEVGNNKSKSVKPVTLLK